MNTERFIHEIENIRSIWDMTSPLYKNRARRERNWRIIGSNLYLNWDELSEMKRILYSK